METSAKTGTNVTEIFTSIGKEKENKRIRKYQKEIFIFKKKQIKQKKKKKAKKLPKTEPPKLKPDTVKVEKEDEAKKKPPCCS